MPGFPVHWHPVFYLRNHLAKSPGLSLVEGVEISIPDLVTDFVTLFVVVDPIGTLPLFIALTKKKNASEKRRIALKGVAVAAVILISFIVAGQLIFDAIGVSLKAFQLAGGIVLFLFGLKMIFETSAPSEDLEPEAGHDVAVFPIAMPSIATPGAILAVVILTNNETYSLAHQAVTTGILLVVLFMTLSLLLVAGKVQQWIGHTGANVLSRVMGMILTAVAAESVLTALGS